MSWFWWIFGRKPRRSAAPVAWEPAPPPVPLAYTDSEGRRHLGEAPYLLPKDEQEIHRLDYQHYILRQVLKGNTFAPVHGLLRRGGNVLDVGCGTGRWAKEIATAYPKTQVIGLDLEEVESSAPAPPNYQFYRGNLLNGLPFTAGSFHYVHQRLLVAAIPWAMWPGVVQELARVTLPGGWVELVEMGATVSPPAPSTRQMIAWWEAVSQARGIEIAKVARIGDLLRSAGLAHIRTETIRLPLGGWGGRIGSLLAQDFLAVIPSLRPVAQSQLGVAPERFNAVLGALEEEWERYEMSYEVYFACGQV
ncbi:MAG TPA: class I SAM-dependent methyltransferase [Ktedonobacteraceae bacterium]|jgi:SAM-dependent methyltransferase|nr:class I SAM-dependent methyltransferase [Ktedonobacteraceae bacterium]